MNTSQDAPKKNNNLLLIVAGVLVILFCCCVIVAVSLRSATAELQVKYVVSGSAPSAMITYNNEQGGTEQVDVTLPFTKEMTVDPGAVLSIVAQSGGSGTLTCEIWINEKQTKTSSSNAQYGVVTCTDFAINQ